MTSYTTQTAEFGKVTFTAPAADESYAGYVWMETDKPDSRRQICHGGYFSGSAVMATSDCLKAEAQKWMRERRRWKRAEEL